MMISIIEGGLERCVRLYCGGGIGKKKSNRGKQWYLRDRVYDSDGISPLLSATVFWIIVKEDEKED